MSEESPGRVSRGKLSDNISSTTVALYVLLIVSMGALVFVSATGGATPDDERPSVKCKPFIDESGNASAICFTSGDVDFEWINETQSENGTVSLGSLPENNSTVRRQP